jgi:hypothetical protein
MVAELTRALELLSCKLLQFLHSLATGGKDPDMKVFLVILYTIDNKKNTANTEVTRPSTIKKSFQCKLAGFIIKFII